VAPAPGARAPRGLTAVSLPAAGLRLSRPANWRPGASGGPLLATILSGPAVVALWRYERTEKLPADEAALQTARRALIAAARARDRTLRLRSSRTLRVDGQPAVELLATERVGSRRREVRSTHVYAHGAEIVLDAYAPPGDFDRVDRTVFQPLVASLRISEPAGT
jgi:hypothetical protein